MYYKYKHINLIGNFKEFIKEQELLLPGDNILLAVSGGVDSVVMSSLFYQANLNFSIAHCNFGLREKASDADEAFVRSLAKKYQVPFYTKRFETKNYAEENKLSIQMAARDLRYQWFQEICNQYLIDKLATAHHTNDCIETLLFNITKGTSLAGLHGILPKQGNIIRPILFTDKESVLMYAKKNALKWREDISNTKNDYARNLIRNAVIPVLKQINQNLEITTNATIERLSQSEKFFQEHLAFLRQEISYQKDKITYFNLEKIKNKPWISVVIWEMVKYFGFNFTQIKHLLQQPTQSGKVIYSSTHQIYVDRSYWMLSNRTEIVDSNKNHQISTNTRTIVLSEESMVCTQIIPKEKYQITNNKNLAALDLDKLQFPLTIRRWKTGDSFYPLGMEKRKKLSDFFIDLKISLFMKQKIWVLVSNDGVIAWVVGHRIDNRFKITLNTHTVYEMQLNTTSHPTITSSDTFHNSQ